MVTRMGDVNFEVAHVTLVEGLAVRTWTGWPSKDEWIEAFNAKDTLAIQAAYAIGKWRESGEKPTLSSLDFNLDDMDSRLIDETGQTVMVKFEQNKDGTLKLGDDKKPIVCLDKDGNTQFFYADTGDPVPPTEEVEPPSTTSPTRRTSGSSSGSRSRTPK